MIPDLSRRGVVAGLSAAPLASGSARAAAASFWDPYARRLAERLRDAGGGQFDGAMARALLVDNNRFRAEQHESPLAWDDDLAACARAHAADMAHRGFFDHRTSERLDAAARVAILARTLLGGPGENIAYRHDPRGLPTANQFFRQWRDSPGHRANMLRGGYTHVGYGVVRHGLHVRAVGVFADIDARLASPLPWRVADRAVLERLLAGASPPIARYGISEPRVEQAYDIVQLGRPDRPLPPEVSQLRPLLTTSERRYDVLWGPVFVV